MQQAYAAVPQKTFAQRFAWPAFAGKVEAIIFMGYQVLGRQSVQQLQKHIRTVARDTASVIILAHAKSRMRERKVTVHQVFEVLREGCIHQTPEPNLAKGSLECRMDRYLAGRNCSVVVALCDENPQLLVVTVWV